MKKIVLSFKNIIEDDNPTFIYGLWKLIFLSLQKITLFDLIRRIFPSSRTGKYRFLLVEIWVISNVMLSIFSLIYISNNSNGNFQQILSGLIIFYGVLRVFEIGITQINILMFSDSNHEVRSYKRTIILLLHNYVEIVMWFTCTYLFFSTEFDLMETKSFSEVIYISFMTMASFQSSLKPLTSLGYYLIVFQTLTGLMLTLICLAKFIPLLNNPTSINSDEKNLDQQNTNDAIAKILVENMKLTEKLSRHERYLQEIIKNSHYRETIINNNNISEYIENKN
ncbi:hypothetical protein [Exiguobacterium sp. s183]|uniref:hypothetical protein n=1 Tax=Exiguobacterium sp. s183 TaxID=2751262 RepID=UPI001BEB9BF9|nr:hypothetical protein [Exiguobacterium sp. s183]